MYTPAHYRVEDRAAITAVIRANSFATIVTSGARGLFATHLPFLYDEAAGPNGTLKTHMARANPQWKEFAGGGEVLVVFQGEHGYISPSWYPSLKEGPEVPTWNYEVVHAYGTPRVVEDQAAVRALLDETVRAYETPESGYSVAGLPDDFVRKNVAALVAFEIPVSRLQGKFKLGQNRDKTDVAGAAAALDKQPDPASHRLADAMRRASGLA